jgi:hypothetical protein
MKTTHLHGQALKQAIILNTFLPDPPAVFRKQQVILALRQERITVASSTLDMQLFKMVQQGYLERQLDQDPPERCGHHFYWYRFTRPDRTSERPGYGPGEDGDVMAWKPPQGKERNA